MSRDAEATAPWTFLAGQQGRCPCGRLIMHGDEVARDPSSGDVLCRSCTAAWKGRPVPVLRTPGGVPVPTGPAAEPDDTDGTS